MAIFYRLLCLLPTNTMLTMKPFFKRKNLAFINYTLLLLLLYNKTWLYKTPQKRRKIKKKVNFFKLLSTVINKQFTECLKIFNLQMISMIVQKIMEATIKKRMQTILETSKEYSRLRHWKNTTKRGWTATYLENKTKEKTTKDWGQQLLKISRNTKSLIIR